jgi:hypothetical protein
MSIQIKRGRCEDFLDSKKCRRIYEIVEKGIPTGNRSVLRFSENAKLFSIVKDESENIMLAVDNVTHVVFVIMDKELNLIKHFKVYDNFGLLVDYDIFFHGN